jgi:hypothetical protein
VFRTIATHGEPVLREHRIGARCLDAQFGRPELKRLPQELARVEADKVVLSWGWRRAEFVTVSHAIRMELSAIGRAREKDNA